MLGNYQARLSGYRLALLSLFYAEFLFLLVAFSKKTKFIIIVHISTVHTRTVHVSCSEIKL